RNALQGQYGNAGLGYSGFGLRSGVYMPFPWTGGGSDIDVAPYRGLDGLWGTSATGPAAGLTPTNVQIDLHYAREHGGGSFQIIRTSDQAVLATLSCQSAAPELGTWLYTFPPGPRTLGVLPQGDGEVTILGFDMIA